MKLESVMEFPCGMIVRSTAWTWLFGVHLKDLPDACPLHGQFCKKQDGEGQ